MYETEILELKSNGKTLREIGELLGFSYEQLHNFISRYNKRQRKIELHQFVLSAQIGAVHH